MVSQFELKGAGEVKQDWYIDCMTNAKRNRDPNQLVKLNVEIASGEAPPGPAASRLAECSINTVTKRLVGDRTADTAAMEARVSTHIWRLGEIAALADK